MSDEYEYDEWGGHKNITSDDGYEEAPGLGCPEKSCKAGFFTMDARTAHIQTMHPEHSAAPTNDMISLAQLRPELAPNMGLHSEDHEGAASWVPKDASSLMPNNPNINPKQFGDEHPHG
jgi:hypothetical protein